MQGTVISICNGKGGIGKTSLSSHVAGVAARAGYKVLLIDMDPQGNLARDLGYIDREGVDDKGQGLFESMAFQRPLQPATEVRPNLDVVVGGPVVEDASRLTTNWESRGRQPIRALADSLEPIRESYHLVLIDCPPGERFLQDAALGASRFVIIPTRSDAASLDGVNRVAGSFARVRQVNPELELLGVVLFALNPAATALANRVRAEITEGLGDVAPVFDTIIRYLEAPAVEARGLGMLVHEYEEDVVATAPKWYELRGKPDSQKQGKAATAHKLAEDYGNLTAEIITAVNERTAMAVSA